jgi:hypothetical protein
MDSQGPLPTWLKLALVVVGTFLIGGVVVGTVAVASGGPAGRQVLGLLVSVLLVTWGARLLYRHGIEQSVLTLGAVLLVVGGLAEAVLLSGLVVAATAEMALAAGAIWFAGMLAVFYGQRTTGRGRTPGLRREG